MERQLTNVADRYQSLYNAALGLVPPNQYTVELGCGTGFFAKMLIPKCKAYLGIDISQRAISEACTNNERSRSKFILADLREIRIPDAKVYVSLEVLEHLHDDLGLLERLMKGSVVILSVPSFNSEDHKRYFRSEGSALDRYGALLDIEVWKKIKLNNPETVTDDYFHLLRGRR